MNNTRKEIGDAWLAAKAASWTARAECVASWAIWDKAKAVYETVGSTAADRAALWDARGKARAAWVNIQLADYAVNAAGKAVKALNAVDAAGEKRKWSIEEIAMDRGYMIVNSACAFPEYAGDTLKEALAFAELKNSTL